MHHFLNLANLAVINIVWLYYDLKDLDLEATPG